MSIIEGRKARQEEWPEWAEYPHDHEYYDRNLSSKFKSKIKIKNKK